LIIVAVSLAKGGTVSLAKEAPGLSEIEVGLGWKESASGGVEFDLDASAFLLSGNGKVISDSHFVFYNNLLSPDGAVVGAEDDTEGGSDNDDGDQEVITVNLDQVDPNCQSVAFSVSIFEAAGRNQNFAMVRDAYIRVINSATQSEIVRYDLADDFGTDDAVIVGEIYRDGTDWKFRALGQGLSGSLFGVARHFGVRV
jgi:tellurium resistance protein TerD